MGSALTNPKKALKIAPRPPAPGNEKGPNPDPDWPPPGPRLKAISACPPLNVPRLVGPSAKRASAGRFSQTNVPRLVDLAQTNVPRLVDVCLCGAAQASEKSLTSTLPLHECGMVGRRASSQVPKEEAPPQRTHTRAKRTWPNRQLGQHVASAETTSRRWRAKPTPKNLAHHQR